MRRRIARTSLIAMLAAAAFAVAAGAGPPEHFTDADDYSGVAPCAGFDNLFEGHLDISGMTRFDKQGNPVEDVVHISGWERNWRSDRPDVSITGSDTSETTDTPDILNVNTLDGNDRVRVDPAAAARIDVNVDLGAGQD